MSYAEQRKWSDQYLPAIRRIVGPELLVPSPLEVDQKQATDLIVMRARDMMIAARVRTPGYADDYPWEFTIRSELPSGAKTELQKITEGWADWMLYGHAHAELARTIERWFLIDLHAWRAHMIRSQKEITPTKQKNRDGTCFVAFDLRQFPPNPSILIASSHELPSEKEQNDPYVKYAETVASQQRVKRTNGSPDLFHNPGAEPEF